MCAFTDAEVQSIGKAFQRGQVPQNRAGDTP